MINLSNEEVVEIGKIGEKIQQYRSEKNYVEADRLREQLVKRGVSFQFLRNGKMKLAFRMTHPGKRYPERTSMTITYKTNNKS